MKTPFNKMLGLCFLAAFGFNVNAQIPGVGLIGGNTPKNDYEAMERSKAKEPLQYIHSQHPKRYKRDYEELIKNANFLRYDEDYFRKEDKALKSWEQALANDQEKLAEVQKLDPKFKWAKLKTDYQGEIEKAKEGLPEAKRDYQVRWSFYKTFSGNAGTLGYSLKYAGEGKYANMKDMTQRLNLKNILDSIAIAKKEDPDMKRIVGMAEVRKSFEQDLPAFMSAGLETRIATDLANAKKYYKSDYEAELRIQKRIKKTEKFSYERELENLNVLLDAMELWYPGDAKIADGRARSKNTLAEIEADIIKVQKEQEEARLKKIEAARMPVATLNDAKIQADVKECIHAYHLSKGDALLKTVIVGEWEVKHHKYTNEALSRTREVAAVIKEADGRCYVRYMNIYQERLENGAYSRTACVNWEQDFVNDDNRGGYMEYEIKPENVK